VVTPTLKRLVILGATGDLAGRHLFPALGQLEANRRLSDDFLVLAISRDDWSTGRFRAHAADRLARHGGPLPRHARKRLVRRLDYVPSDVTDASSLRRAFAEVNEPAVIFLALPPAVFADALVGMAGAPIPTHSRVVVEKPFGTSLASSRELNSLLHEHFSEEQVFRIDHFLGKQTVQNILGIRFANRVFEPIWNREHVESVDLVWDETLGLEGRAGYYDHTGALRDMIQNHLLQLMTLVAMEQPSSLSEHAFRDKKVELLRSVRPPSDPRDATSAIRARYSAGRVRDAAMPAYVDEPGVAAANETETFASVQFTVENERWAGVPFRLRAGKALGDDRRFAAIRFRPVGSLAFGQSEDAPANRLTLTMSPDRMLIDIALNGAGDPFSIDEACLDLELAPQELSPYARLLLDVFEGDLTLSIRDDEAEECWRIVEPILDAWSDGVPPMREYAAGSAGPEDLPA
jgi:glucose-6-phosphate 1-dehydrogenase